MPIMDGYEATSKIRMYLYKMNIEQPIISAVTGHTEQSYIDRAIQAGMNQILSKPVKHDVINGIIN